MKQVILFTLSLQELSVALRFSRVILNPLSWKDMSQVKHSESLLFCTTLQEPPLFSQTMTALSTVWIDKLSTISSRMPPSGRKTSTKLSWKRCHFFQLWMTMRELKYLRPSQNKNSNQMRWSLKKAMLETSCTSLWRVNVMQLKFWYLAKKPRK